MAYRDYYNLLGVPKRATQEEIKQAYRSLARRWHPDRNPDDDTVVQRFKDINEAYNTLGDPEKRTRYDRLGPLYTESGRPPRPDEVNDAFGAVLGSIFRRRKKTPKGNDLRYTLSISLEDVYNGTERIIHVPRQKRCTDCKGDGAEIPHGKETCVACTGTGNSASSKLFRTQCYHCEGRGFKVVQPCKPCDGSGVIGFEDTLKVKVPPGVATGQKLKLAGKGNAPAGRGKSGELFVIISVSEHRFFQRRGADLITTIPITFSELVLGAEIEVPTMTGTTKIRVAPGTPPGQIFRLTGKGLPKTGKHSRGDLHLETELELPATMTPEQKNHLESWMNSLTASTHPKRLAFQSALQERQ